MDFNSTIGGYIGGNALFLLLLFTWGCVPARIQRIDFTCVSTQQGGKIVSECADPESWKEWIEKNKKSSAGGEL